MTLGGKLIPPIGMLSGETQMMLRLECTQLAVKQMPNDRCEAVIEYAKILYSYVADGK